MTTTHRSNTVLRGHFRRDGKPKVAMSRNEAWAIGNERHMDAYRCDFCEQWHLAKRKKVKRHGW